MKTDIREDEKSYFLDIEVPGFDKNDIKVSLEDGYLTVSAAKQETAEGEDHEEGCRGRQTRCFAEARNLRLVRQARKGNQGEVPRIHTSFPARQFGMVRRIQGRAV